MKAIVYGGSHHNTLGVIRSLGAKGLDVVLLLEPCNLDFCSTRFSRYIKRIHILKSSEEGLDILCKYYSKEMEKSVVVCVSDASVSLLDSHYDELKDKFRFFNAGETGRINRYLEKGEMIRAARECGIDTIRTWEIVGGESLPSDIVFPCILKPSNSSKWGKTGLDIYRSPEELKNSIKPGVGYLIQEYVEKEYEVDVVGLSIHHGAKTFTPALVRKIRDYLDRQSVFIRLDDINDYPNLPREAIDRFVKRIGYEGIFSVEFLYASGKYYFLEINMRNDGCGYIYTKSGVNYPYQWAQYAAGLLDEGALDNVKARTPLYMMQEPDLWGVFDGRVKPLKWVCDFMKTRSFFTMSWRDPLPFLYTVYVHIRQAGKKLARLLVR